MFTVHAHYRDGSVRRATYSSVALAIASADTEHTSCDLVTVWAERSGRMLASREDFQWRVF